MAEDQFELGRVALGMSDLRSEIQFYMIIAADRATDVDAIYWVDRDSALIFQLRWDPTLRKIILDAYPALHRKLLYHIMDPRWASHLNVYRIKMIRSDFATIQEGARAVPVSPGYFDAVFDRNGAEVTEAEVTEAEVTEAGESEISPGHLLGQLIALLEPQVRRSDPTVPPSLQDRLRRAYKIGPVPNWIDPTMTAWQLPLAQWTWPGM